MIVTDLSKAIDFAVNPRRPPRWKAKNVDTFSGLDNLAAGDGEPLGHSGARPPGAACPAGDGWHVRPRRARGVACPAPARSA